MFDVVLRIRAKIRLAVSGQHRDKLSQWRTVDEAQA